MKICANCGAQVSDDASFCNNCGSSLVTSAAAESAQSNAAPVNTDNAQAGGPVPASTPVNNMAGSQQQIQQQIQQQGQQQYGQAPYQQYVNYDPSDHTSEFDPRDIADNKLFAIIPYLFGIIAGVIVGIYVKESPFVKFHIKNAIRLELATLLSLLLAIVPFIGWVAAGVLFLILVIVDVIAIVWVFQGKAKDLPLISSIGFLK